MHSVNVNSVVNNRLQYEAPDTVAYSPEPGTEVCCLQLNFKISK